RSGFGHFASRLPGSRLLGRVGAWLKRRIVLAELHGLDDRTLADLRISRGDFQAIAEAPISARAARTTSRAIPEPPVARLPRMQAECRCFAGIGHALPTPETARRPGRITGACARKFFDCDVSGSSPAFGRCILNGYYMTEIGRARRNITWLVPGCRGSSPRQPAIACKSSIRQSRGLPRVRSSRLSYLR